jgi:hypothetical protein
MIRYQIKAEEMYKACSTNKISGRQYLVEKLQEATRKT